MINRSIIFYLLGRAFHLLAAIFALPIFYASAVMNLPRISVLFFVLGSSVWFVGKIFSFLGRKIPRRFPILESSFAILIIYPLLAIFAAIPFVVTYWLSPVNALLETISDLTSTGISILPNAAPYIFRLWQSSLMWLGSLIFLIILVTILPEVSGCFGISLSLPGGQNFSPMIGQMHDMAGRVKKVYIVLTVISFVLLKLAGLNFWDALLMAMRCISTGGGDFFPGRGNIYVEYAAMFTMLIACGNFLFFHRMVYTTVPPKPKFSKIYLRRLQRYLKLLPQNISANLKQLFTNSEVKIIGAMIFFCTGIIFFVTFRRGLLFDGNECFRYAVFHIISFMSTTGICLADIEYSHDFDKFLVFVMAIIGGCIGSVTGGFKIMRVMILFKITAAEIRKTFHPHMMTSITVNGVAVPKKIVGRILAFFFLATITIFICAAILSFTGSTFSGAVSLSAVCLTTVGILPGICDSTTFLNLSPIGKFFCMLIMIIGRLEIFALLILLAGGKVRQQQRRW